MAKITAKEIAEMLGVSTTAVSLALNGKSGVSEKTRELVVKTAKTYGYKVSQRDSYYSINPVKTLCFMIFVGEIAQHSAFSSFVLQGIESTASTNGYNTLVRYLYADHILEPQNINLVQSVDALVLLGTDICKEHCNDISTLLDSANDIPKVVLDNMLLATKVDCISNDNYGGSCTAISYLIEQGFNSIGYIRSKQRIMAFEERERGITDTLNNAKLTLAHTVNVGISSEGAYNDMIDWLQTQPDLPRSFFAENDVVAAAAIRAMKSCGISVPSQVSVIGFDDVPIAEMTDPRLTTIKSFMADLGATAVHVILNRATLIQKKRSSTAFLHVFISTQLQKRESVATSNIKGK